MEALGFERGAVRGRPPSHPSKMQARSRSQSAQRDEGADLENSGSAASRPASISSKSSLSSLSLPISSTEARSHMLGKDIRIPNPTPLPDIPRKGSVLKIPGTSRSQPSSREPSAGPSAQQQLDERSTKDASNGYPQTPSRAQARESVSGSSSRPSQFDCISIPLSSPTSSSHGFKASRKRAMSVSSSQEGSRKRQAAVIRSTSNTAGASSSSPLTNPDSPNLALSDASDDKPQLQLPSSQKIRAKSQPKKKTSAQALFQKPTDYEKFYSTKGNTSEDRTLLQEAELALKDSKARQRERDKESVVPSKIRALTSCPFCSNPWPKSPSKRLVKIGQPLLDQFHKSKNKKLEDTAHLSFCALHEEEASIIPQGKQKGWPTAKELKWSYWEDIFFEGGADGEHVWVLRQMCERVLKPGTSSWLRSLQEKASKDGARTITSAVGLLSTLEDERVGYFGEVGSNEMMKWLKRAFIEDDIPEDRNPFPGATYNFDTPERQASLQPLNANGFVARCLLPELACCLIRVREGCSFEEANEIRIQSSAYGDAILPMLADKDEGDYLEFDLQRDVQREDSPPPTSSLVPLPPAGTPKRRNLRGSSSQSSSPATRRAMPSSDGIPESSDSPLYSRTGRPLRAAAAEAADVAPIVERPKPHLRAFVDAAPAEAPSSQATIRPKARQFKRVASAASVGRVSVYSDSDDEEGRMPAPSQMPPASQRPRPRPIAKTTKSPIDIDSDDDYPRAKVSSSKRTRPEDLEPSSTQKRRLTRTTSKGSIVSEQETLQDPPVAGSSQDPIPLPSSDAEGEMEEALLQNDKSIQARPNAVPHSSSTSTRPDSFSLLQPVDVEQATPPTSQIQTLTSSSDVFTTQLNRQSLPQGPSSTAAWFGQGARNCSPEAVNHDTNHRAYAEQAAMPVDVDFVLQAHQNRQYQGHYGTVPPSTSDAQQVSAMGIEDQLLQDSHSSAGDGQIWYAPHIVRRPDSPRHPGPVSRHASFPALPPQQHPFGNTAQPPLAQYQPTPHVDPGPQMADPRINSGHGAQTFSLGSIGSSTLNADAYRQDLDQTWYRPQSKYYQSHQQQAHHQQPHPQYQYEQQKSQHYQHQQQHQHHIQHMDQGHLARSLRPEHVSSTHVGSAARELGFAQPVQYHSDPFFSQRILEQASSGQGSGGRMIGHSGSGALGSSNVPSHPSPSQPHTQTPYGVQQTHGHDQHWVNGHQGPYYH